MQVEPKLRWAINGGPSLDDASSASGLMAPIVLHATAMPARLVHKADFESLMSAPTSSRSAHFALHHVARHSHALVPRGRDIKAAELSTELSLPSEQPVHNLLDSLWAGAVVPKRHARRAVTRNLLKRQIRRAFERHEALLAPGLWLIRLRRNFAAADFVSARSRVLAEAARTELDELLRRVPPPARRGTAPA